MSDDPRQPAGASTLADLLEVALHLDPGATDFSERAESIREFFAAKLFDQNVALARQARADALGTKNCAPLPTEDA